MLRLHLPVGKAVKAVTGKVKTRCRQNINLPLEALLHRLNPVLRGWTAHFRPGVSSARLRLPARLHLAPGHPMATPQTPRDHLEGTPPPLLQRRMVARRR